ESTPLAKMWRLASVYASGTLASQLLVIASLPLLARLYGPEAFGRYGAAMGVVGFVAIVCTLRLEVALHIPKSDRIANELRRAASLVVAISSLAVAVTAAAVTVPSAGASEILVWSVLVPA